MIGATDTSLRRRLLLLSASAFAVVWCDRAKAFDIQTNIPDLTLRWDNTITENELFRTQSAPSVNLNNPNNDDTDRNIPHGLAAARTDLLSELDLKYLDYGVRASVAAWWDAIYSFNNSNNSPNTLNTFVGNNQHYSYDTERVAGYSVEIGDLFTYGGFSPAPGQRISYRIGQFAQLWGESLYLATNSIAYGMNPIDAIKGQLLLNPEARDVYMPTPQISVTYQPFDALSLSAYWKLGWRKTRIGPEGSYFAATDVVDAAGDKLFVPVAPGVLGYFQRSVDNEPIGRDQFGVSARYNLGGNYNFGLYALMYDEPAPQVLYLHPGTNPATFPVIGTYQVVYPRNIQLYGASVSGNVFDVINVGAEISTRVNTDLVAQVPPVGPTAGIGSNARYPVGDTLHGNLSFIYASPPVPAIKADQIQVTGEVGFNQLLTVTANKNALAPGVNSLAALGELVVQANYYSVFPGWDLSPSIGVSPQLLGTSAVDAGERAHTGSFNVSMKATLNQRYNFTVRYQHYWGQVSDTNPNVNNLLLGRDFLGISFNTTL